MRLNMALMAHRGPLKKSLTPIGIHRPGQIVKHQGKGSAPFPQPKPGPLTQGAPSMNNYAKATPVPTPPPAPMGGMGGAPMGGAVSPPLPGDTGTGRNNGMV